MLTVPFNGDLSFVDYASSMGVGELYGQLSYDYFGGGRTPFEYPTIDENILQEAIQKAHQCNMSFSYTMNFLSLANMEFDHSVQLRLFSFIDSLVAIGVDALTVSNPFLISQIKANFPGLFISASVVLNTSSLEQIELLASLGANRVILSKSLNKDFQALEMLTKSTDIELQLIVNDPCLQYCPFHSYHNITASFSSMRLLQVNNHISFCTMLCRKAFLEKPFKLIKATYIRPEDLERYRKIGISSFKLVDRKESSPWLKRAILAYHNETYKGNFADLCSFFSPIKGKGEFDGNSELRRLRIYEITDINSIIKQKNNLRFKPFIDNENLGKHIDAILNTQCRGTDCQKCGLCASVFTEIGYIDEFQRETVLYNINLILNKINRRDFWISDN